MRVRLGMKRRTARSGRQRDDVTAGAVIASAADAIIAVGADRAVTVWNPAAERLFGWSAAEVTGREPPFIPEELMAEYNAVLERVASGGQVSFATRRTRKDGSVVDLRIDVSAVPGGAAKGSAAKGGGGQPGGWVSVCHQARDEEAVRHYMAERARVVRRLGDVVADMNAQLDLESVLDRIAASLRELTRADAGGFVLIEAGRLRLVSLDGLPETLRGRTADLATSTVGELMRSGKTVLMATGEAGRFDDLIWSALPGLHTITVSLSHVGGRPFGALYALYSGRKVGHIDLELLEMLAGHASVALSNVTAFEEVNRQLAAARELEEAKDLFLATTSHELRTPITIVQGFAATLVSRWDKLTDADRRAAAATIADRAGSLARLVEQLLLGSRAGADQLTVRNDRFDLAGVLRGAAGAFGSLADRHTLRTDVPDSLPAAWGDPMATDIIVGQLLENAFKYSPAGGPVTVSARRDGDWIDVTVTDEGIGIPPADRERVFERFVQGDAGDRRRFGGIGLGLYIVRQLARAQDAEVSAEAGPGGGTTMRLRLRQAPPGRDETGDQTGDPARSAARDENTAPAPAPVPPALPVPQVPRQRVTGDLPT